MSTKPNTNPNVIELTQAEIDSVTGGGPMETKLNAVLMETKINAAIKQMLMAIKDTMKSRM